MRESLPWLQKKSVQLFFFSIFTVCNPSARRTSKITGLTSWVFMGLAWLVNNIEQIFHGPTNVCVYEYDQSFIDLITKTKDPMEKTTDWSQQISCSKAALSSADANNISYKQDVTLLGRAPQVVVLISCFLFWHTIKSNHNLWSSRILKSMRSQEAS